MDFLGSRHRTRRRFGMDASKGGLEIITVKDFKVIKIKNPKAYTPILGSEYFIEIPIGFKGLRRNGNEVVFFPELNFVKPNSNGYYKILDRAGYVRWPEMEIHKHNTHYGEPNWYDEELNILEY